MTISYKHTKIQLNLLKNEPMAAEKLQPKLLFLPVGTFSGRLLAFLRLLEQEFEDRVLNIEFRYHNYLIACKISAQFVKNCTCGSQKIVSFTEMSKL